MSKMSTLLFLWFASAAQAGDLVIHQGPDAAAATARVVQLAGVPADSLTAVAINQIFGARPPVLIGGGSAKACVAAPTTTAQVAEMIAQADVSAAYMEVDKALSELSRANSALGCLAETVDPTKAARLHYLRGIILFSSDRPDDAQSAFVQAHLFDPEITWDDNFAPDPKRLFDAAAEQVANSPKVALHLVPPPEEGGLLIDGVALQSSGEVELGAGDHLVQFGLGNKLTTQVYLEEGTAPSLVIPPAIPADAISWADNNFTRPDLGTALQAVASAGSTVYVTGGAKTWRVVVGDQASWEAIGDGGARDTPRPDRSAKSSSARRPGALAFGGLGLAVVGGALSGVGYVSYLGVARDAERPEAWTNGAIAKRQRQAGTLFTGGLVLSGVGVGASALGFGMRLAGGGRISPAIVPGGAGVHIVR